MKNYFSSNLKFLREERNLSKSQLASKLNVNSSTITRWENAEMGATVDNAYDVANFFNISVADLTGEDLTKNNNIKTNKLDLLYSKTKDILSDDDKATIEFLMEKAIDNYEKNKNKNKKVE